MFSWGSLISTFAGVGLVLILLRWSFSMKFHSFQFWYQSLYFWQCQHAFYFVCFHLCPLFMLHLAVLLYNSKVQVSKYSTCAVWRVNLSLWLSLHCQEVNSPQVHSLIDIISSYPVGGERKIHIYIQNMDWCIVRLEICQKNYTTIFLDKQFYTLKTHTSGLFSITKKTA